jgi:hypothetical protein
VILRLAGAAVKRPSVEVTPQPRGGVDLVVDAGGVLGTARMARIARWGSAMTALGMLLATVPSPVVAQACHMLPVSTDEIWMGAVVAYGGPGPRVGGHVAADVRNTIGVEAGATWGGYESAETSTEIRLAVSTGVSLGGWSFCPYAELRLLKYPFRHAFDLDRGDVTEDLQGVGLGFGGALLEADELAVRWRANLGLYHRVWYLAGRRIIVEHPEIYQEEVHRRDRSFHLAGTVAGSVEWRGAGVTLGVATRPQSGDDGLIFMAAGFRVSKIGR